MTTVAIPSTDPSDLLANAGRLDEFVSSPQPTYTDRFGVLRKTIAGAVAEAIASISTPVNRGAWASATAYSVKDIVLQSGTWYVCVVAHTSSGSFATDLAKKWRIYQGVLLSDLSDLVSNSLGAALMGYNSQLGYAHRSVGSKLNEAPSIMDLMTPTQVADVRAGSASVDVTAAILAALNSGVRKFRAPSGIYKITASIVIPAHVSLVGEGPGLFEDVGATVFLKTGNFTGVVLNGASQCADLIVQGAPGNGGDGVQVLGGRSVLRNVTSVLHGRDGIKVGDYSASAANTNLWHIENCISRANTRHGCFISHEGKTTTPDANAGTILGLEASYNGVDGLRIGEAVDNTILGLASQSNGGWGFHLMQYAKGNHFIQPYTEINTLGDFKLETGADRNTVTGYRSGQNQPDYANLGADNVLKIRYGSISTLPLSATDEAFVGLNLLEQTTSGLWKLSKQATTRNMLIDLINTGAGGDVVIQSTGGGAAGLRFDTGGDTGAFRGILKRLAVTINFGSIPTNSSVDQVVTLAGVDATYMCYITAVHAIPAGINVDVYWDPSAGGSLKARATNTTGGSVTVNGAFNLAALKIG